MRKHLYAIVLILIIAVVFTACDKDGNIPDDCYADQQTIRTLNNKTATVNWDGTTGYLVEEFTYDTRLYPCKLPGEFQVDKLVVKISGDVKAIPEIALAPCCADGIVLTSIKKADE